MITPRPTLLVIDDSRESEPFFSALAGLDLQLLALRKPHRAARSVMGVTIIDCPIERMDDSSLLISALEAVLARLPDPVLRFVAATCFTESAVIPLAVVRQRFHIPGFGPAQVARFRDKLEMKRFAQLHGIAVAEFAGLDDRKSLESLCMRTALLVLKPRLRWSCEGQQIIGSEELLCASRNMHDKDAWIAERFLRADLLQAGIVCRDGAVVYEAYGEYQVPILENVLGGAPVGVLRALNATCSGFDDLRRFLHLVVEAFAPGTAMLEVEMLRDHDTGQLFLCEISIRPAGVKISTLHELSTAYNPFTTFAEAIRSDVFGGPCPIQAPHPDHWSAMVKFYLPPGKLTKASILADLSHPDIRSTYQHAVPGHICARRSSDEYLGVVFVEARSVETREAAIEWVLSNVEMQSEQGPPCAVSPG